MLIDEWHTQLFKKQSLYVGVRKILYHILNDNFLCSPKHGCSIQSRCDIHGTSAGPVLKYDMSRATMLPVFGVTQIMRSDPYAIFFVNHLFQATLSGPKYLPFLIATLLCRSYVYSTFRWA